MMEEVLNGVLECPVCLDRMDASCRVLPCQHTFHAECLHSVSRASSAAPECPECRSKWHGNVDDLPPNVLLMRLLEEMQRQSCECSSQSDGSDVLEDVQLTPVDAEDGLLDPVIHHPSQEILCGLFDKESIGRREVEKSCRRSINKGKRLKHEADQETDPVLQCLMYVKSALCFLAASAYFEEEVLLIFLTKVLSLLKFSSDAKQVKKMSSAAGESNKETVSKILVLSLRLQSILYRRMFECVEKEVLKSQKVLQNYHRGYCTKKKLIGMAASMSEGIYSVFVLQNLCFSYLYNWRSQWKKADKIVTQHPELQRLFNLVDHQCSAMSINSNLKEGVRYVGTTLRILNAAHSRRSRRRMETTIV